MKSIQFTDNVPSDDFNAYLPHNAITYRSEVITFHVSIDIFVKK